MEAKPMNDTPHSAAPDAGRPVAGAARARWLWAYLPFAAALRKPLLDERTRFLSGAVDHADLKLRMDLWDARQPPSSPWALWR